MSRQQERLNQDINNERFSIHRMFEHRHDVNFNFGVFDLGLVSKTSRSHRRRRFAACRFYVHQSISRYRYLLKQQQLL